MSGDVGLDQPIVFYSSYMTAAKRILLEHKGIILAYETHEVHAVEEEE
tara:strand:+ start:445 stop:588 length:144 start_codon:yes stop_codon:yes gene_type:complete